MREEISEPQHWRSHARRSTAIGGSWGAGHRVAEESGGSISSLPVEVVDAAFADESIVVEPVRRSRHKITSQLSVDPSHAAKQNISPGDADLVQSLAAQLGMLEAQQEHLRRLLAQTQGN